MATMPDTSNLPVGDPDGRRLARQRASKVAHAARILELARFILRDSGFERSALDDLITELTGIEAAELQRAHGKVGSRKRFKHGSSHPLLDSRSTIFLFIDESGKDDVGSQSMENVFALGAISIDDEDSREYVTRADDLKQKYFGRTTVNFHEPHIRNRDREYYFQGDVPTQDAFQSEHSELMQSVNFQIFGAAIRKQEFVSGFVDQRPDPYLPVDIYWLAIAMLLERFTDFVLPGSSQRTVGASHIREPRPQGGCFSSVGIRPSPIGRHSVGAGQRLSPVSRNIRAIRNQSRFAPDGNC